MPKLLGNDFKPRMFVYLGKKWKLHPINAELDFYNKPFDKQWELMMEYDAIYQVDGDL